MRKFKRRQRRSLPFALFLAVAGALLLPAALAPRANAGSTDYWDSEYPLGSRPRPAPELFSQPQGVLINQPLASNYNPTLALNVAPGEQPGAFQPLVVDALFSWIGGTAGNLTTWSTSTNWSPAGPPGAADTAEFNSAFSNQPNLTAVATVGELLMTTGVAQNVTLTGSALTINGVGGTGIQIDNTVGAFTLTINNNLVLGAAQAWTNNSGNLFTVNGGIALSGDNLTVNGTGDTLISGNIAGGGATSTLTKDGSGTLTLTGTLANGGNETVNGGTLLMNGSSNNHIWTVNNAGTTLGGTGTIGGTVIVNAGANLAPGNGGNTVGTLTVQGPLTLAATSNFRIDINGTTAGSFDQVVVSTSTVTITNSNLVVTVGTTLSPGQTFLILNKVSGGAITGTFAQGSTVTGSDGTVFSVSYTAGNGNDIVLTVIQAAVPEPSTWIGGAFAIAGLAFMQRRRLRKLIAFSR
jgi:hypothetical protein